MPSDDRDKFGRKPALQISVACMVIHASSDISVTYFCPSNSMMVNVESCNYLNDWHAGRTDIFDGPLGMKYYAELGVLSAVVNISKLTLCPGSLRTTPLGLLLPCC